MGQFRTCKQPSIYCDDVLSHGMSVLAQYFHLVSTTFIRCIQYNNFTYLFTWNITKQTLEHLIKAKTGTKIFMLTLSITFWSHLGFQVISSFNIFLTHTLNICSWHVYLLTSVLVSNINREFLASELRMYFTFTIQYIFSIKTIRHSLVWKLQYDNNN